MRIGRILMENKTIDGVWFLKKRFSNRVHFAYLDTQDDLVRYLFVKYKVGVKFLQEAIKDGEPYKVVFARCKYRDIENLLEALKKIPNEMAIYGHHDYIDKFHELDSQIRGLANG